MSEQLSEIKSIYCIGRNYAKHAEELGNDVPSEPLLFGKPQSAAAMADGSALTFPSNKGEIHYELEIVLRVGKDVEAGDSLKDAIVEMALGIDLTLRDVQSVLKKKGHPWLRAKGFRNSAIITEFFPFPGEEECKTIPFYLAKNEAEVQRGLSKHMLFTFSDIFDECQREFGLKEGDLLFTGTPEGVGAIAEGDTFALYFADEKKGSFQVRLI